MPWLFLDLKNKSTNSMVGRVSFPEIASRESVSDCDDMIAVGLP
jgi:hypothetical protein